MSRRFTWTSKSSRNNNGEDSESKKDRSGAFPSTKTSTSTRQPSPTLRRGQSVREQIAAIEKQYSVTSENRQYDLTPVDEKNNSTTLLGAGTPNSYTIDPFEFSCEAPEGAFDDSEEQEMVVLPLSDASGEFYSPSQGENDDSDLVDEDDYLPEAVKKQQHQEAERSTFIGPSVIHPNMENKEEEVQRLRLLAGKLSPEWGHADFMAPALARRIRDFQFAQEKRRKKYGDERPWGILGVYDHLSSIRIDVEWAEDAARRRANGDSYQSWADFDENKQRGSNRPYFTYILLFLCTAVMIASIAVNDWAIEPLDENPMIGPSAETLVLMGAKDSYLIVNEKEGWRLVTASVLHAGLVHYFINMLALWFVGAAIEMSHGWVAAFIIFTLSAIGGTVLSAIFLPEAISVGASGGIFGFIGACLADIIMNWRLLFCDFVTENGKRHRHAFVVVALLLDILLNSIIGLTPYVDNYNHLGGMVYGFLCGLSTIERLSADFFGMEEGFMNHAKHFVVRFFGLIVTLASIIATIVILLQGDATETPCPGCTWLSCVPFPPWADNDAKWWYCDDCGRVTADIVVKPSLHLEVNCPSGAIAIVELDPDESKFDREEVKKNLPNYCREYCPLFEAGFQSSTPN